MRRHDSRRRPAAARTAALALLLAAPAAAQQRDSARAPADTVVRRLAPIEVQASIAPSAGPRVGSGVPGRIQTLSRERLEAWEPRILPDVLAGAAGVSVYDDLGSPFKLNLSTRGFSAGPTVGIGQGVAVFLDGVRQNEADAQEVDFDLLPMEHVRRVELLSGTASLLGPNALGGAVNLVTERGEGPPHGDAELSAGSFGTYAAQASAGGTLRSGWSAYAGGGAERERGWREATGASGANLFASVGRYGARSGFRLAGFGARSRAETAGSLPESIFGATPRTNFTAGDFEDLSAAQLSASGYLPLGAGTGSFRAYGRAYRAERFNVNQPPDASVRARTRNATLGGSADWRWTRAGAGPALSVRGGVDGAANAVRVRIFASPADGGADSLTTSVRSPGWDVAGYALADLELRRVTLSGGARYDLVRVPFRNVLRPQDDATNLFRGFSPRGGVSVRLGGGASAYASLGRSFRAPAILELGCADPDAACPLPFALGDDPPLAPVRATTAEAGAAWAGRRLSASASLYRTEVRDEIFFVASDAARLSGYFTNLPRTRREGAELSLEGTGPVGASWYASYAYTRAMFRGAVQLFSIRSDDDFADSPLAGANEVEPGDRLPLVPAHQAKAGALLPLPRGFSAGADLRWVGRQWLRGDEANDTRPLDPYLTANARAGFAFQGWELSATATNVLDSHRAVFGTFNENRRTGELERFLTPQSGRAVKLTLRRAFGARTADTD